MVRAAVVYFVANLVKYNTNNAKIIFGIQTPNIGDKLLLITKEVENCMNNIYAKHDIIPKPKCRPVPPFIFFVPIILASIVSIIIENGNEILLYFSK